MGTMGHVNITKEKNVWVSERNNIPRRLNFSVNQGKPCQYLKQWKGLSNFILYLYI
jgi:hypothetical protein